MASREKKSYLSFRSVQTKRSTKVWDVFSTSGAYLGRVEFYPQWRRYVFCSYQAVFDADCLEEIARFAREETSEWREEKKS